MAYSKADKFSKEEIELATIAKALAHPARVAILKHIAGQRACICGDIVEVLPLSQATVSQHLKELKTAGLIKGKIDGPRVCYCLNESHLKKAIGSINRLFTNLKCC